MTEFIIATNNKKKLVEIERILSPLGIVPVTASEKGIDLGDVEETGATFAENAYIKAKAAYDKCGLPVIADDSGLCVDALDGRPGIYSARYGGHDSPYTVKIGMLLDELKDVPADQRGAHFSCAVCCIDVTARSPMRPLVTVASGMIPFSPWKERALRPFPLRKKTA